MASHHIFPKTQELLLFLLSLILSPLLVTADQVSISTSCAAALIVVATVMLLLVAAYIAYYIRRYGNGFLGATTLGPRDMGVPETEKGMRAAAVEALPSAPFSEIKMRKLGQVELECAVCLIEFQDAEILRLLPGCCHVFHCECIGPWLAKHVTCPICRADVGKPSGERKFGALDRISRGLSEESDHHLTVQIDVSSVSRETNGSLPHGVDRSLGSDTTEEVVVQVTEDNSTRTLPKELCPKSDYRESVGKLKGWNCFSTASQVDSNSMADSSIHI